MSDLFEEYGLEEEALPPEPSLTPKKEKAIVKKKGGWLGRIIALFLGVIIGIGACVGGVFFIAKSPVQSVFSLLNIDYEGKVKDKILSSKYGDKTVLDIVKATAGAAKAKKLSGLSEIFPVIEDVVEDLSGDAENSFGIKLETKELLNSELTDIAPYLFETVKTTPVGQILKATNGGKPLEPMLMEICYGEEDVDYTVDDETGDIVMKDGLVPATLVTLSGDPTSVIAKVSVASVVKPSVKDTVMLAICYGKQDITFEIVKNEKGLEEVKMKPLFLNKNGDDKFIDYNGEEIQGEFTPADNGFTKVVQYRVNSANQPIVDTAGTPLVKQVYYVKDDGKGNYLGYEEPATSAKRAEFKKVKIMDMQDNSDDIINNILLADALNVYPHPTDPSQDPHSIMFSLAYGIRGEDYEIVVNKQGIREIRMLNGATPNTIGYLRDRNTELINDVLLADIMSESRDDAVVMYLLYGKEGIHYAIDPVTDSVVMLQRRIALRDYNGQTHVYNEYGEFLQEKSKNPDGSYDLTSDGYMLDEENQKYTDSNGITYKYTAADPEIMVKTEQGPAKIYYLSDEAGNPVKYRKSTVADLTGEDHMVTRLTGRLTVAEVMGTENIEENTFLKHVANATIEGLPDAIGELTFGQVFEEDMYLTNENGEYVDNDGNVVSKENRVVKSEWKYLLKDETGEINTEYKVAQDMDILLENMTKNIEKATLSELAKDSIIEIPSTLVETPIRTEFKGTPIYAPQPGQERVGDLTTLEMVDYLNVLLLTMELYEQANP